MEKRRVSKMVNKLKRHSKFVENFRCDRNRERINFTM